VLHHMQHNVETELLPHVTNGGGCAYSASPAMAGQPASGWPLMAGARFVSTTYPARPAYTYPAHGLGASLPACPSVRPASLPPSPPESPRAAWERCMPPDRKTTIPGWMQALMAGMAFVSAGGVWYSMAFEQQFGLWLSWVFNVPAIMLPCIALTDAREKVLTEELHLLGSGAWLAFTAIWIERATRLQMESREAQLIGMACCVGLALEILIMAILVLLKRLSYPAGLRGALALLALILFGTNVALLQCTDSPPFPLGSTDREHFPAAFIIPAWYALALLVLTPANRAVIRAVVHSAGPSRAAGMCASSAHSQPAPV